MGAMMVVTHMTLKIVPETTCTVLVLPIVSVAIAMNRGFGQ